MKSGNLGRGLGVAAVFAFGGPVVGAILGLLAVAAAMSINAETSAVMALAFWPWAILIGAFIGFIPAAMTGVVMALASTWLKADWSWIAASGAVGLATTAFTHRHAETGAEMLLVVGVGLISALVCGFVTHRIRPR